MDSCCDSVTKLDPTLWDLMDCSTPGFSVLHCLLVFAQTHGHSFDILVLTPSLPAHLSSSGGGGPEAPPWAMFRALSSPGPSQGDGERGPQSKFSIFLQYPPPPTTSPYPSTPFPTPQLCTGPGILPSGAFLPLAACLWEGRMGGPPRREASR